MNELSIFVSGGLLGGVLVFLLKEWISTRIKNSIKHEYDQEIENIKASILSNQKVFDYKYKLKYEACMSILEAADMFASKCKFIDTRTGLSNEKDMVVHKISDEDLTFLFRDCLNKFSCSCDSLEVLNIFFKIASGGDYNLSIFSELREAIRKELSFSDNDNSLIFDRDNSYIMRVGKVSKEPIEFKY